MPYARLNEALKADQDTFHLAVIGGFITYGTGASRWHKTWHGYYLIH